MQYAVPPEPQCPPPSPIVIMKPPLSSYSLLGPSSGHEERLVCCRSSTDWKQWLYQFYFWSHKVSQACSLLRVWHWPSTGMKKWEVHEKILHLMLTWQQVWTWVSGRCICQVPPRYSCTLHIFWGVRIIIIIVLRNRKHVPCFYWGLVEFY